MSQFNPSIPLPSSLPPVIASFIRTLLVGVGGVAIGRGWVDAEQATQIAGAVVAVGTALWSIYASWHKNQKLKAAILAPAGHAE